MPSSKPNAIASKKPCARGGCFGALLRMGDHRLPQMVMSGELESAGKRGPGGEGETMDGLRGRGSSAIWHRGGLEQRCA